MQLQYLEKNLQAKFHEAQDRWQNFLKKNQKAGGTFSVVIIGQQNNGKSTLCNALLKDWTNRKFPVSDTRETTATQEAHDPDADITYVDTPGFGTAWASDATRAREEWCRANLLLFVHSVRGGELDADECAVLQQLRSSAPQLARRLFVVCSKFGDEEEKKVEEVCHAVRKQVTDILGVTVPVEPIDSIFYHEGKSLGDEQLAHESHMPVLLRWIEENRHIPSPQEELFESERNRYLSVIHAVQEASSAAMKAFSAQKLAYDRNLLFSWDGGKPSIENAWNACSLYKNL